ncbi:hypothetical protein HK096_008766 [Nowakowskiella sp. JEL0078]|nr:hypothetical protein HK096_008766 [Nowakowskiella sp. JEL0078]
MKRDSFQLTRQPQTAMGLIQLCFFLAMLSQFGDSDEIHLNAIFEYSICKQYMRTLGEIQKTSHGMVNELERVERNGWNNEFKNLILRNDIVGNTLGNINMKTF